MSLRSVFLVAALAGVLGRGSPLEPASPLGPRESRREKGAAYESREYARQERRRESERRNRGAEARAEEARAREETHLVQDDDLSPEKQQELHLEPEPLMYLSPVPVETIVPHLGFTGPYSQYAQGHIPGWIYGGEATLTNDYLQVTPYTHDKLGWVWTAEPTKLGEWQAELDFYIGGKRGRGAGGGMAFWFTKQQGRSGALYGHSDTFDGFGLFFDTYDEKPPGGIKAPANHGYRTPFVAAIFNSGQAAAGDPVINSVEDAHETDYFRNQAGICAAHYRNLETVAKARIIWQGGRLSVWLDLDASGRYQLCLQTEIGDRRVKMPNEGYFGMTAATSISADTHVVYQMRVATLEGLPLVMSEPDQTAGALENRHMVHRERGDETHHVKLTSRSGHADGAKPGEALPGADADVESAHETQLPPQQTEADYLSRFSNELFSIEMALWDLNVVKNTTLELLSGISESLHFVISPVNDDILKAVSPIGDKMDAQHSDLLAALADVDRKLGGSGGSARRSLEAAPPIPSSSSTMVPQKLHAMPESMANGFAAIGSEITTLKNAVRQAADTQARLLGKLDQLSVGMENLEASGGLIKGKLQELRDQYHTLDRSVAHALSNQAQGGGGSWFSFLLALVQAGMIGYLLFLQMNAKSRRGHLM